jgi:hypothetical protein
MTLCNMTGLSLIKRKTKANEVCKTARNAFGKMCVHVLILPTYKSCQLRTVSYDIISLTLTSSPIKKYKDL